MKFQTFEDNGGGYHWTIVAGSGERLVQSATFSSYEEARQAARMCATALAQRRLKSAGATLRPSISPAAAIRRSSSLAAIQRWRKMTPTHSAG